MTFLFNNLLFQSWLASRSSDEGWRPGWDLHPRIMVLQTIALLLGYQALCDISLHRVPFEDEVERVRGIEPPVLTLAMSRFTTKLHPHLRILPLKKVYPNKNLLF